MIAGGRNSGKSHSIAKYIIIQTLKSKINVLCTRKTQTSISDSVHRLLCDIIVNNNLEDYFTITDRTIKSFTGSEIVFYGLQDSSKIKSMENVEIVFLEECDALTDYDITTLIPTFRSDSTRLFFVFNPRSSQDAVYKNYITPHLHELNTDGHYTNDDLNLSIQLINYTDNPFISDSSLKEIELMKASSYSQYEHHYLGVPNDYTENAFINSECINACIDSFKQLGIIESGRKVAAYDPADSLDGDTHGLCVLKGNSIQVLEDYHSHLNDGVRTMLTVLDDNNVKNCVYDSVGIGAGVEGIANRPDLNFVNYKGGSAVLEPTLKSINNIETNGDMYLNLRVQSYDYLKFLITQTYRAVHGEYIDPKFILNIPSTLTNTNKLIAELSRLKLKSSNRELLQLESKADMTKRGVSSPNLADSLAMAIYSPLNAQSKTVQNWNTPLKF